MSQPQITLSASAARQIKSIVERQNKAFLRVSVVGGGCSGFSYKYDLEAEAAQDDLRIERDGAVVLVDPMSVEFLDKSEIDYVDELIGASFQIRNPNAVAACGCGVSFAV